MNGANPPRPWPEGSLSGRNDCSAPWAAACLSLEPDLLTQLSLFLRRKSPFLDLAMLNGRALRRHGLAQIIAPLLNLYRWHRCRARPLQCLRSHRFRKQDGSERGKEFVRPLGHEISSDSGVGRSLAQLPPSGNIICNSVKNRRSNRSGRRQAAQNRLCYKFRPTHHERHDKPQRQDTDRR
jgi:hypothetical protein